MIETFKIIHEIDKVDKNLFFKFDSGGSRCGPVWSGGVPVWSGWVRWGLVGYLVIPHTIGASVSVRRLKVSIGYGTVKTVP